MLIAYYLNFRNERLKLKNVTSRNMIPFYLTMKEKHDIKVIVTKRTF